MIFTAYIFPMLMKMNSIRTIKYSAAASYLVMFLKAFSAYALIPFVQTTLSVLNCRFDPLEGIWISMFDLTTECWKTFHWLEILLSIVLLYPFLTTSILYTKILRQIKKQDESEMVDQEWMVRLEFPIKVCLNA